jgi:hypothetical protein
MLIHCHSNIVTIHLLLSTLAVFVNWSMLSVIWTNTPKTV